MKGAPEPEFFFPSPSNDFSQSSSCCQGVWSGFIFSHVYTGPLGIAFFPEFLRGGVCGVEPAVSEASLPKLPATRWELSSQFLLALFYKVPQQIGILLAKEVW